MHSTYSKSIFRAHQLHCLASHRGGSQTKLHPVLFWKTKMAPVCVPNYATFVFYILKKNWCLQAKPNFTSIAENIMGVHAKSNFSL
jgi:hypothetical protein